MIDLKKSIKRIIPYNFDDNLRDEYVNICYGIDDDFCRCTATSIVSFVKNNINTKFIFHIIGENISNINKTKFKMLAQEYHLNVCIYEVDSNFFNKFDLPIKQQWPISMYFRFIFPAILSNESKIFYIDADIICLNEANALFLTDLNDKIIGAVQGSEWGNKYRNKALNLKDHIYFNSGVLIIDIKKWNKNNIADMMIKELVSAPNKFELPDQDVLNLILHGKVKYLKAEYNWFNHLHANDTELNKSNIVLLHFTSSPKPWNKCWIISPICNSFNKNLYKDYENLTPWKDEQLTEPKNENELKLYIKCLIKENKYISSIKYGWKFLKIKL